MSRNKCYALYAKSRYAFSWNGTGNKTCFQPYAKKTHGDILIITLHLDSKISTLSYKWKNSDVPRESIAYDNITREDGLSYRLAITLFQSGLTVKLIP